MTNIDRAEALDGEEVDVDEGGVAEVELPVTGRIEAPEYATGPKLQDVFRLLTTDLASSRYFDARAAMKLIAAMSASFRDSLDSSKWEEDELLRDLKLPADRLGLFLSAAFDLVANAEYCRGRVVNARWIYCSSPNAGGEANAAKSPARVFFSFLKQCPHCSFHEGLEKRISGAQHKPSSHHIGEITTGIMAILIRLVTEPHQPRVKVGVVVKQSHDVDAALVSDAFSVLLEVKASPLVTFPIAADLDVLMLTERDGEPVQYRQHSLVDFQFQEKDLYFYLPHVPEERGRIMLGRPNTASWPYEQVTEHMRDPENLLSYFSAWLELYRAFSVPKTSRAGRVARLGYLTNGWGDEIDSNKTKPGLGRTDDLKKGTYQMLKYGAYYKEEAGPQFVYSTLLANLDPVNFWAGYLDKLTDVRWTKQQYLEEIREGQGAGFDDGEPTAFRVAADRLHFLYEAIMAFNRPLLNAPVLKELFSLDRAYESLIAGQLDAMLAEWRA